MYGVVLWCDVSQSKAVIWCEDHGDLAFYNPNCDQEKSIFSFSAGDLVRFDVDIHANLRMVSNPKLVRETEYPTLANRLKSTGTARCGQPAQVIAFPTAQSGSTEFEMHQ